MRVDGCGNPHAQIAIVGSSPGWQEAKRGQPFVGKTGDELDHLLEINGLPPRSELWLTNLYREFVEKDYEYTAEDLARDLPALRRELDRVQPWLVVPLGREATQAFLGSEVDISAVWGLPWDITPEGGEARPSVCFPQYHVAAGFHNSDLACYVTAGFQALAAFVNGEGNIRRLGDDPYPTPHYEEITTEAQLRRLSRAWTADTVVFLDTEGYPHAPYSLQISTDAGTGFLIRSTSELLRVFYRTASERHVRIGFHAALHDLRMMAAMGIPWDGPFEDTMCAAYLLQLEAQGLKPGCLRHCGMVMQDYADLMGDTENELTREYLLSLWRAEKKRWEAKRQSVFNLMRGAGQRVKALPKLPKSRFHKAVERVIASKKPSALWRDQDEAIVAEGVAKRGFVPEASLDDIAPEKALHYACRDADGTGRYHAVLKPRIVAMGLEPIYNLELATYPYLVRMMEVGVKPDLPQFARLSGALQLEINRLQGLLEQDTFPGFNANSGDHVADFLFGRCGLAPMKMTKSGDRGSTNDKILEALERAHPEYPVLGTIRAYRETYKLKHTFVDPMPSYVDRWPYDGRIHAIIRGTRVVTGRLAMAKPNLLGQPEHGAFAEDFKRGWVCEPGHFLYAADESQVELRVLAHLSQDPVMLSVYRGEARNPDGSMIDLHAKLAHRVFGGNIKDYMSKCQERLAAKAVNFGLSMGMTAKGLTIELRKNGLSDVTESDAQHWIDETDALYVNVPLYKKARIKEATEKGYIRFGGGRIRYIGGIRSKDDRIREEAEREAFSSPIQGGAAYIMKQAEVRVWREMLPEFWKRGVYLEPILQVHDCLKFEAQEGCLDDLHRAITDVMTNVPDALSVPLVIEGEWGLNMADTTKLN